MSEEVLGFSTATPLIPHLVRVELVREGPWPVGESIRMPAEVFTLLQPHAARWDREHCLTVLLDGAHRIVGIDDVAVGCVRSCPVHTREVFKAAILANAAAILVPEEELRNARLGLCLAVKQVLVNGLALIGVSAPETM